mmetsp:Transcript_2563/g.7377  ORF Transcript_2563/g.7377 Transcript_2563/m.7377 type:complete len:214 (-) Transcript_2563:2533-3174(-)
MSASRPWQLSFFSSASDRPTEESSSPSLTQGRFKLPGCVSEPSETRACICVPNGVRANLLGAASKPSAFAPPARSGNGPCTRFDRLGADSFRSRARRARAAMRASRPWTLSFRSSSSLKPTQCRSNPNSSHSRCGLLATLSATSARFKRPRSTLARAIASRENVLNSRSSSSPRAHPWRCAPKSAQRRFCRLVNFSTPSCPTRKPRIEHARAA